MEKRKYIRTKTSIEAEEIERHRIAKDIHDSLGQQLSGIKLYLNTLTSISSVNEQSYKTLVLKSITALDDAIIELSEICFNLMPAALNTYGLIFAIDELAHKMKFSKKINIDIITTKNFPALDKTLETNIFRVIQEFVNNSIKHGKAKNILIQLECKKGLKKIELILKDDGNGFDVSKSHAYKGMGLKNVKSRIDFHKGKLTIKSKPNSGAVYEIIIPLKNTINDEKS